MGSRPHPELLTRVSHLKVPRAFFPIFSVIEYKTFNLN
jgi:hypothetical protein